MPWLSILLRMAAITVLLLWLLGGCARDENQQEVQQQNESVSGGSTGFAEHGEASVDSNEKPLTQQDGLTASSMSTQPTQSTTVDEHHGCYIHDCRTILDTVYGDASTLLPLPQHYRNYVYGTHRRVCLDVA